MLLPKKNNFVFRSFKTRATQAQNFFSAYSHAFILFVITEYIDISLYRYLSHL